MGITISGGTFNSLKLPPGRWNLLRSISQPKTLEDLIESIAPEQQADFVAAIERMRAGASEPRKD
jgi:hypothetical protein